MSDPAYAARPMPSMDGLAGEFYAWCAQGQLRFQRCASCHAWRHVPREMCAGCGSFDWTWERSAGRGRVFTWTTVARPMHPAFSVVPYAVTIVEMAEGVRLATSVLDCAPGELQIGMEVHAVFEEAAPGVVFPYFRRARDDARETNA